MPLAGSIPFRVERNNHIPSLLRSTRNDEGPFGAGGHLGVTQLSALLPWLADERGDRAAGNLVITLELPSTSVGYAASNLKSWPAAVGRYAKLCIA